MKSIQCINSYKCSVLLLKLFSAMLEISVFFVRILYDNMITSLNVHKIHMSMTTFLFGLCMSTISRRCSDSFIANTLHNENNLTTYQ